MLIIQTPFRTNLVVRADGERIVGSEWTRAKPQKAPRESPVLQEAERQLRGYFAKKLVRFDLPLHFAGTDLQVRIWDFVSRLEVGELISYGDVARVIGAPGAHRAVASAMGRSPYALLIPAHRVVGSDGEIKGAAPNSMRRKLLVFEGIYLK